jgi:Carboxylesterase family
MSVPTSPQKTIAHFRCHRRQADCLALAGRACFTPPATPHLFTMPAPRTPEPATMRRLATGELVGSREADGTLAWRGIRYAAPAVGALRWRAPQATPPQEGVFRALAHGPMAPQFAGLLAGTPARLNGQVVGNEDCLSLNVFAPPGDVRQRPVMVWGVTGVKSCVLPHSAGSPVAMRDVSRISVDGLQLEIAQRSALRRAVPKRMRSVDPVISHAAPQKFVTCLRHLHFFLTEHRFPAQFGPGASFPEHAREYCSVVAPRAPARARAPTPITPSAHHPPETPRR